MTTQRSARGGLSLHRRLSFAVDPGHGFAQSVTPPRKTRRFLAKTLVFRLQALDPALQVPAQAPELGAVMDSSESPKSSDMTSRYQIFPPMAVALEIPVVS